jgi:hypothetical protein
MTALPARRPITAISGAVPDRDTRPALGSQQEVLHAPRPTPAEWARRRRAERDARRVEAAGNRAVDRLAHLGPAWHVVDWPRTDLPQTRWLDLDGAARQERAGFLAIGPGGVFAVTVADHGRARVLLAGDIVQINGRRPPYVPEARRDAERASRALSAAVGHTVPVVPVLTFVGSGVLSVHGLPKGCLVAGHRELDRLLVSGGARISPTTARKLSEVAGHPATWLNAPYRSPADYRWFPDGRTAADKRATPR